MHGKWQASVKKKEGEAKEKAELEKRRNDALKAYEELNERERYIIEYCINHNELVFEEQWNPGMLREFDDRKHIYALEIKGFGESNKTHTSICFNAKKFQIIKELKGDEVIEAWKQVEEEEYE